MGRLRFLVFAMALASAIPGFWRAWEEADAAGWFGTGDGVLFWLTWAEDPGGRRLVYALILALALLVVSGCFGHSRIGLLRAGAATVRVCSRLTPTLGAVALALLPQLVAPLAHPDPGRRPSVVVVLLDSVRLDHVGWGGSALPTTPRLDALAKIGAPFTEAISQAPWTKPAVATLFTSMVPGAHEATARYVALPMKLRTLAEAYSAAGYRSFGLSSNPNVDHEFAFDQGFLQFYENTRAGADDLIARAEDWIGPSREGDRPFFLYLHLNDAHYPYTPRAESTTKAGAQRIRGLFGGPPIPGDRNLNGDTEREFRNGGGVSFSTEEIEALRLAYAEEIRWMDDQVGAFLARMLSERDDLLIVVLADHGEEFLDHGDLGHGHSLYDELVRVPLQFAWSPALGQRLVLSAGVRGEQVRTMDVAPTLLEACGLSWPGTAQQLEGVSLLPALRGGLVEAGPAPAETDHPGSPLAGTPGPLRMLREPGWKLVISDPWFDATAGRSWLFDLAADAREQRNLAGERPEEMARMRSALDRSGWLIRRDIRRLIEVELSPLRRELLSQLGYANDDLDTVRGSEPSFAPGAVPWMQDPK